MFFNKKKKQLELLQQAFGTLKEEEFDFDKIALYHLHKERTQTFIEVSDQIWDDLDMDLFFCYIDRTTSKIGQQYLYHQLRAIQHDPKNKLAEETIIQSLSQNKNLIFELQYWLTKLNDKRAYHLANLFQGKHIDLPSYYFLVPLLSFTVISILILGLFNPSLYAILVILLPFNALIHYLNKTKVNVYIYSIPLLLSLNKIAKVFIQTKALDSISEEVQPAIRSIDKIKRRISVFKLEQKVDSDLEIIYWFLLELCKITFLLEPLLLFNVIDRLKSDRDNIEKVFDYVGKVDLLIAKIALRSGLDSYCLPDIGNSSEFKIKEVRHPLVSNCIPNSITIKDKSCLITGSNMSGKTTFIRAIGLSYISGVVLNTCFAQRFSIPLVKLKTVIRVSDDVSNASSYFFKEVSSMKEIIADSKDNIPQLVLLDELFKGTNTVERIAAAKAVLSYLHKNNCKVFAASHDIELTNLLASQFDLYHFSEAIIDHEITFDYQLKPGILKNGNAISILALNDFPEEIISDARGIESSL